MVNSRAKSSHGWVQSRNAERSTSSKTGSIINIDSRMFRKKIKLKSNPYKPNGFKSRFDSFCNANLHQRKLSTNEVKSSSKSNSKKRKIDQCRSINVSNLEKPIMKKNKQKLLSKIDNT